MDATTVTLITGAIGSMLTLVVQVINIVNTNYKEARNRRWAQEDKEELARTTRHTVKETGQSMNLKFEEQRALLEDIIRAGEVRLQSILDKIEENTQVSKQAFKEANGVNAKLMDLGAQIRDGSPKPVVVVNEEPIPVKDMHS